MQNEKKTTSGTVETRGLQLKTATGIAITVSQNCLSKWGIPLSTNNLWMQMKL